VADVEIAVVFPDLLGTYGDGGNARILEQRLRWRGIGAGITTIAAGSAVPASCDIYVLGGGEDAPQALAAAALRESGTLGRAVERGAAVLAVCAGFQVIGTRFRTTEGEVEGVGLIDADSRAPLATRAVGELVVESAVGVLSGYENHASATVLGAGVTPFGQVRSGVGNGDGTDGAIAGRVLGTYLHGPALARNPEVADLVLSWVVGTLPDADLGAVDADARELREERLAATQSGGRWFRTGWSSVGARWRQKRGT